MSFVLRTCPCDLFAGGSLNGEAVGILLADSKSGRSFIQRAMGNDLACWLLTAYERREKHAAALCQGGG